jgi:formylglycine-generating enzyme required for sulfatase activity
MLLKILKLSFGLACCISVVSADQVTTPLPTLALDLGNKVSLSLVLIPAGKFMMGSPDSDKFSKPEEKPQHEVTISKPFYMGIYTVTQQRYDTLMGADSDKNLVGKDGSL